MFPFLIGKVLTVLDFIEFEKETLFPFLIGKVLTEMQPGDLLYYARPFPFLIGKVLTKPTTPKETKPEPVSIPYR